MAEVSIVLPVYNEIKFIERTLYSVIGEADEIIIADNASIDGTSEVCKKFAQKYSHIKYIKHSSNIGSIANFEFGIEHAKGRYIQVVGGHDLLSRSSTKNRLKIFADNRDAVTVYSKNMIKLDKDYCFVDLINLSEEFAGSQSDSVYKRVIWLVQKLKNCFVYYGLHEAKAFKKAVFEHHIVSNLHTDHATLTNLGKLGKFLPDQESTFYSVMPRRNNETWVEQCCRIVNNSKATTNPYAWLFSIICGSYEIAIEMPKHENAPKNFAEEVMDSLLVRFGCPPNFNITLDDIILIEGKVDLAKEVFEAVKKHRDKPFYMTFLSKVKRRIFMN